MDRLCHSPKRFFAPLRMTSEESLRMTSTPRINEGPYFELYILKGGVVIGDVPPPARGCLPKGGGGRR